MNEIHFRGGVLTPFLSNNREVYNDLTNTNKHH